MKTYKLLSFLFLIATIPAMSNESNKSGITKEKKLSKTFTVNSNATLEIDNSYGDINLITWDGNQTVIDVLITASGKDKDDVLERLSQTDVTFSGTKDHVSAKTIFKKKNSSWWNGWSTNHVNLSVNYTIKVPENNHLDLANDYGAIILDKTNGNVEIDCDYGRLEIGELNGSTNNLSFDYSKNSTIEYINNGRINADYSGFTIDKAGQIDLNADYTISRLKEVKILKYNCDYGKLSVDHGSSIKGQGDYLTVKIGELSQQLDINADYGAIRISQLLPTTKQTLIKGDYTNVKLGYHPDFQFTFKANLEYASLKGKDELTITKSIVDNGDKYYEGYFGNPNAKNTLNISVDYGSLTILKSN